MCDYKIISEISSEQWFANGRMMESEALENKWITFHMSALDMVLTLSSGIVLIAIDNYNGQPIGSIIGCNVPETEIVYIGSYFVSKKHRGEGIGHALYKRLLSMVGKSKILVTESIGEMTSKYRNEDFPIPFSYCITRLKGSTKFIRDAARKHLIKMNHSSANIIPYEESLFDGLLEFDRKVSGRNRSDFLKTYLNLNEYECMVATDPDSGEVVGYGVKCPTILKNTNRIGPLYANHPKYAYMLLIQLLNFEGQVLVCVPANGDYLAFLYNECKCKTLMRVDRSCSKSYKETVDFSRVFCVTNHLCQPDC